MCQEEESFGIQKLLGCGGLFGAGDVFYDYLALIRIKRIRSSIVNV